MLRIAIFGSECTGKTTLTEALARFYQTYWVPEYSRAYAMAKPCLDSTDVIPIMRGQITAEANCAQMAEKDGKKLLLCDTIPLSSVVYSQYYNKSVPLEAETLAKRYYSLYLLTDIDVPWEEDDVRDRNINRPLMHLLFKNALEQRLLPYTLLCGTDNDRFFSAVHSINQLLSQE